MADLAISIAGKLIEVIGNEIIQQICDTWGYESELEKLKETVCSIRDVLLDADHEAARRELSNQERGYIQKLKDAVYDADDLFDEFLTLAKLKQIKSLSKVQNFFTTVCCIFSFKNQVGQAYKISNRIKEINNKLDSIATNRKNFKFNVEKRINYEFDVNRLSKRREETCSYVNLGDIVGRDEDKDKILNMLLGSNGNEDICCVTIVGVGGSGKTALAQLIFNDENIRKEFPDPEYRIWVCVADQEGVEFDAKIILSKIVEVIRKKRVDSSFTLELVVNEFQECLKGKKYFLVLDDVWSEVYEKWNNLIKYLRIGQGGSRIVVTTRSHMTATIIGLKYAHTLEGLSKEASWCLFELSAFGDRSGSENYQELVEIGKKIIKKCYNLPLAIKVVGSLLFGQGINKWKSFEHIGLADISKGDNKIFSILEFSYHSLTLSLKSCFSYCALFPKDSEIGKELLLDLWMAQGFVVPLYRGQSIEDAAEEHFLILLRRCFFQDIKRDSDGNIVSLKIHDLLHDVAQKKGKEDICILTSITNIREDRSTRHMCIIGDSNLGNYSCSNKARSFIGRGCKNSLILEQIGGWKCLRVLDLCGQLSVKRLPDSMGELILLKYLNLSYNKDLEELFYAFTKLHNLQTLKLHDCSSLKILPKDFYKLNKLRHLDLKGCNRLACMPLSMDKLTNLRVLPFFVAYERIRVDTNSDDSLKDLKALTNIKGDIYITIGEYRGDVEGVNSEGGYLKNMEYLTELKLEFEYIGLGDGRNKCVHPEAVLRNLEPPRNLKRFHLRYYEGKTIERWGRANDNWAISFPHLVRIDIDSCKNLEEVPILSKLSNLKSLTLYGLRNLEYIESNNDSKAPQQSPTFYPSLEFLALSYLDKVQGWRNEEVLVDVDVDVDDDEHHLVRKATIKFPHLSILYINECPNLVSSFCCPRLKKLELRGNNKRLRIIREEDDIAGSSKDDFKLREVKIDRVCYLKSLATYGFTSLNISNDEELECLSQLGDAIQSYASFPRILHLYHLKNLTTIDGLNHHLEGLEELCFLGNQQLSIPEDEDEPWKSFLQNLRSLELCFIPKLKTLPKGIQYLTSLQTLKIWHCTNMESLPEWISCLSSLHSLTILDCPEIKSLPKAMSNLTSLKCIRISECLALYKRCKEPHGEDYSKIQHIPEKSITEYQY